MASNGRENWVRFQRIAVDPEAMLRQATNAMETAYYSHRGRAANKWHHYLACYDRHFSRFRGKPVRVLEIGIDHGGSLQLWKTYFGEQAHVFGIDTREECRAAAEDRIVPLIGSQSDVAFLRRTFDQMGGLDVVIDDGCHIGAQQIVAFETLYPLMSEDGVYLLEDIHTNYWETHEGGYRRPGTFVEYAKSLVDKLNAWYIDGEHLDQDFARMTEGIFFYDSIIAFEKRRKQEPIRWRAGS
jgi:cephalosporin hydroxylase